MSTKECNNLNVFAQCGLWKVMVRKLNKAFFMARMMIERTFLGKTREVEEAEIKKKRRKEGHNKEHMCEGEGNHEVCRHDKRRARKRQREAVNVLSRIDDEGDNDGGRKPKTFALLTGRQTK